MEHNSGEGSTRVEIIPENASHTECTVFGNKSIIYGVASVYANVYP